MSSAIKYESPETTETCSLSVHVLDTSTGQPGRGMPLLLEAVSGTPEAETFSELMRAETNDDGRVDKTLIPSVPAPATYRMTFFTKTYFDKSNTKTFYPVFRVYFTVEPNQHFHIPLLASPFGVTTYRGS